MGLKRGMIVSFVLLVITMCAISLTSCSTCVVCKNPYIQVGDSCCLDSDENRICDIEDMIDDEGGSGIIEEIIINAYFSYENPQFGFMMKYPAEWEYLEKPNQVEFYPLTDEFQEIFMVISEEFSGQKMNPEKYIERYVNSVKKEMPGFTIKSFTNLTVDNMEAMKMTYTYEPVNSKLEEMLVAVIKDDIAYMFRYSAEIVHFESFIGNVFDMIETFKFPQRPINGKDNQEEEEVIPESGYEDYEGALPVSDGIDIIVR